MIDIGEFRRLHCEYFPFPMSQIESLFGVPSKYIHPTCILAPFLPKGMVEGLQVKEFVKGRPFSVGLSDHFTLVHTNVGAPWVGDAVLHLKETPCNNLILFGTCGAVMKTAEIDLGSILIPGESYNFESFSQMLIPHSHANEAYTAEISLLEKVAAALPSDVVRDVRCASVGSIQLEAAYLNKFRELNVDVVDMECSAFYCAAQKTQTPAAALFYVTDIIGVHPNPFQRLQGDEQKRLEQTQKTIIKYLLTLANELA